MGKQSERITPRADDYSKWYLDVVRQGDLAEPAEVVKGCMVIKPHGYAIWEKIQRALDDRSNEVNQSAKFPSPRRDVTKRGAPFSSRKRVSTLSFVAMSGAMLK